MPSSSKAAPTFTTSSTGWRRASSAERSLFHTGNRMYELTLLSAEAQVDLLSDALMELDALSVSVEDTDADTEQEEALWGEPGMPVPREAWQRSTIKSLFPTETDAL